MRDQLSVSFDPSLPESEQVKTDADDNLLLNEDVEWMADFEKAVDAGMAMKINLTAQEAANGFDKIFVAGIRFKSNKDQSKLQLEQLLTDHFYNAVFMALAVNWSLPLALGTVFNMAGSIPI